MISSPASPAYGNISDTKLDGPEALLFFIFLLDSLIWNKLFLSTQNQKLIKNLSWWLCKTMLFSSLLTASAPPLFLTHFSIITSESVLTIYHVTLHRSFLPLSLQIWSAKQFHWSFFASRYFSLLVFFCFCSLHCVCFSLTLLLTRSFNYHVPLSGRAFAQLQLIW